MISFKFNLHSNSYPESITSASRNLDTMIKDDTRKLTTVCRPYVKGLAEKIQKICNPYDIRTIFTMTIFDSPESPFPCQAPNRIQQNCVYSIPCNRDKVYKSETCLQLKIRQEEHGKAVVRGEIEKSDMADHIWKEK